MTKLTGADRRTTGSHSVNLQAAASAEVPLHPQASVLPAAVSAPDQLPVHTSNAEPDRVPIGARIRQVSKVGQYGAPHCIHAATFEAAPEIRDTALDCISQSSVLSLAW